MAGIAALGAAVGGLAKGYMEGEKHRSDMEDAEARRGLIRLQTEEANLKLGEAKREKEYRDARQKMYDEFNAPDEAVPAPRAAGITPPGETVANPAAGGVAAPGAAPAAPAQDPDIRPGAVAPSNDLAKMEKIIARSHQLDLKYGKISPMEALEGMKKFRMYQDEGVIDGLRYFQQSGDAAGAIQRINATGKFQMPAGTRFEVKEEEVVPGSGMKAPNVYAISPDGSRSLNYRDLLRSSLSPKDALSMDNEVGYRLADLSLKKTAEENLNSYRQQMAENDRSKTAAMVEHYRNADKLASEQRLALAEQQKDLNAARAAKIRMETSDKALDSIFQQFGVSKELSGDKFDMLSDKQKETIRNNMNMGVAAHTLWKLNQTPDGKEGISTQDAIQITKNAGRIRAEDIKQTDDGQFYFSYGNKKVFVPAIIGEPAAPAAGKPAQPGGIAMPGQTPAARQPYTNESYAAEARAKMQARDQQIAATRREAAAITPQQIAAMSPQEARAFSARYNNYLTLEQRRALNQVQ